MKLRSNSSCYSAPPITISDRTPYPTMRLLQTLFGLLMTVLVLVTVLPASVYAASSAAVRAYDDVESFSKDYSGQSLIRAEFTKADLKSANFNQADLRGAVFNSATLTNANLHGANLSDGIAYLTDLSGADLSDAILTSAMLLKSAFRDTKVTGADFSDAVLDRAQVLLLCKSASGVNPVTGVDTRESLGCR